MFFVFVFVFSFLEFHNLTNINTQVLMLWIMSLGGKKKEARGPVLNVLYALIWVPGYTTASDLHISYFLPLMNANEEYF